MRRSQATAAAILVWTVLSGCSGGSDPARIIEGEKVDISGEQVAITPDQVLCGERAGLWKIQQGVRGASAVLTPAARTLGFADDVVMGDTRFTDPYAQISGAQQLKVSKVSSVTDEDAATKRVAASVGVVIKNSCFDTPLPMHGVSGGAFSQTVEPRLRLRKQSGWKVDRILH
jgi:hypothetical protein